MPANFIHSIYLVDFVRNSLSVIPHPHAPLIKKLGISTSKDAQPISQSEIHLQSFSTPLGIQWLELGYKHSGLMQPAKTVLVNLIFADFILCSKVARLILYPISTQDYFLGGYLIAR
jgi:hypothetical protein